VSHSTPSANRPARRSTARTAVTVVASLTSAALVAATSFGFFAKDAGAATTPASNVTPTASTPTDGVTRTIDMTDGLKITVNERGHQRTTAVLVLHGGGGPHTVIGFSAAMAENSFVITPTHPGFDGTPRPDWTNSMADLAETYLDLIEKLHVRHVLVVGSSFGAWIGSEMALRDTRHRITGMVLLDGVAIAPEPPVQIGDPAKLGPAKTAELAFYNPALRPDPSKLTEAQKATAAANQQTTALYSGPTLSDPKLQRRLHRVLTPVLVLAGEEDGIAPLPYQHALADSFPNSTFQSVPEAGHFPHIEQPELVLNAVHNFTTTKIKPPRTQK
jgi:pimeloyl-ACP methyl ester carboxylesterase